MKKNIFISFIICALLTFVLIYMANYHFLIFHVIKNILFGLGCITLFWLVYKMVETPWGQTSNTKFLVNYRGK